MTTLYAPSPYGTLSPSAKAELVNGCGSSDAKFDFVPDNLWGLDIYEACCIHDYMYTVGTSLADKEEADRVYLNNMLRLIEADNSWFGSLLKMPRRRRALVNYEFVTAFGGPAFWAGKNKAAEEIVV